MRISCLALALSCLFVPVARPADKEKAPTLTDADQKYLDGLLKDFLVDPKGATRVTVPTVVRSVWGGMGYATVAGWLFPAEGGKAARVCLTDGASILVPPESSMKKTDFIAECKARYSVGKQEGDPVSGREVELMRLTAAGIVENEDLALAAWLHRLGQPELAARALAVARKAKGAPRDRLRDDLAWSAFAGMVHAYMARADAEALGHGERLLRLYPAEVKKLGYTQAEKVVADLRRRKKNGTFGKTPAAKPPGDFAKWDAKKKAAYLIDQLDEVDARQQGQPGGANLASDWRVAGLIQLGDAAVPALLDAMEKDERLMRSVYFFRDFFRGRTVLGTKDAILTALRSIVRVRVFEWSGPADYITPYGEEKTKECAKTLRAYWEEFGKFPFDERMLKVLISDKATFELKREAAKNLASGDGWQGFFTLNSPTPLGDGPPAKPNPAVAKFSKPTAAEATLRTMDADLATHDAKKMKDRYLQERIEAAYLDALIGIGDKRIAPTIAKRTAEAKSLRPRRQWAIVAHVLGEPKPFAALADEFRAGKTTFPRGEEGDNELRELVNNLIAIGSVGAEKALAAMTDPKHPQYPTIKKKVLDHRPQSFDRDPWLAHPFCFRFLRAALDDKTLTGKTYEVQGNTNTLTARRHGQVISIGPSVPNILADVDSRREKATERACDVAGETVAEIVIGVPAYHLLLADADKRVAALARELDRFDGKFRVATGREESIFYLGHWHTSSFLPDIRPLGRPATAADLKAGRAVFHLSGKGKVAALKLPALAVCLAKAAPADRRVLIVQAEVGPDGKTTYGVIARHEIRTVTAGELTKFKSFEQFDKEEEAIRPNSTRVKTWSKDKR